MKHSMKVTLLLILVFLLSQIVGVAVLYQYCSGGELNMQSCRDLPLGVERPQVQDITPVMVPVVENTLPFIEQEETKESTSISLYLFFMILIGTGLLFLLIKLRGRVLTKIWFALAVIIGLSCAFAAFFPFWFAIPLGIGIGLWKLYRPNVWVANGAEVFLYGGIASLFYLLLNMTSATILLIAISIYDMIAVWQSRHMVALAQYQTKENMFAGALFNYSREKPQSNTKKQTTKKAVKTAKKVATKTVKKTTKSKQQTAILGGGDMAFPLFFTGAILKTYSIHATPIIILCSTLALAGLLFLAKKEKFYPAMPFISAGCFVGYGLVALLF